ncbi:MAG: APC family permease [Planctomycetaceae bacterium]
MSEAAASATTSEHGHKKLGQLAATSICGNDITSSCLYVSALAIVAAGKLAPISLLMVAAVLFLFRKIYAEVVGALPLNGGAYNALLNTTSKRWASVAACLTVLSYMATAVISALEGMHYVHNLWDGLNVLYGTIALLAFFMLLTIIGITESAIVAIVIFITHLATLTLLLIVGIAFVFGYSDAGLQTAKDNFASELPATPGSEDEFADLSVSASADGETGSALETPEESSGGSFWPALFFGFAVSMLGISGFESSSNFVEEQEPGVFPKTLRNMWIAVSFFNPLMALLALAVLTQMQVGENQNALLAYMGEVAGGPTWGPRLSTLISIDAAMVLSGAVLTSFVGVTGLVHRMTLDRCLPQFLLKTNARGTTHRIIVAFFLLCVSVLAITTNHVPAADVEKLSEVVAASDVTVPAEPPEDASDETVAAYMAALDVSRQQTNRTVLLNEELSNDAKRIYKSLSKKDRSTLKSMSAKDISDKLHMAGENAQIGKLAGIYTISFLAVMALFGIGNVLLKLKRKNLPRPAKATWPAVFIAIAAVLAGLIGNAVKDTEYLITFLQYFLPAMAVILIMLSRISLLGGVLGVVRNITASIVGPMTKLAGWVRKKIDDINSQQIVFFTRGDNTANLNNAVLYVKQNEHTNRLKIVTITNDKHQAPPGLREELNVLDKAYPEIDIEYIELEGDFSPELITKLSDEWNIPKNLMFIGSPGGRLGYSLAELGGVRLII